MEKYKDAVGVTFRVAPPPGQTAIRMKVKSSGGGTFEVAAVVSEVLALQAYRMISSNSPHPDTVRLDKLEKKVVNVRHPLRYGSKEGFWASPEDVDGGPRGPSDIRKKIDEMKD